jgi:hypothetical protein
VKIDMYQEGEWMATRIHAEPEGTEPAAEILIRVNTGHPNSYAEYGDIASVFTRHFMEHLNAVSDHLIKQLVAEHPDIAEEASMDIFEAARLAGFSVTEAQDMADVVRLDEGGTAG